MAYDLHTHTVWCDGKSTPEEMVLSAIDKGLDTIGVCCHSYCEFTPDLFLHYSKVNEFIAEVHRLKEKYKNQIQVLCGVELDVFTSPNFKADGFDYIIGSNHNFKLNSEFYAIDFSEELFVKYVNEVFGGDFYSAAENYFEYVGRVISLINADIIGHFDLIKKFNIGGKFFDENHPRYVSAWKSAVDKLIPYNKPFEINVGGLIRVKGQTNPYPSDEIRGYILSKGGKFVFGSDSHSESTVGSYFNEYEDKIEYSLKGIEL